ncbi:ectD, partial [Symbiodinium sp. KB8]
IGILPCIRLGGGLRNPIRHAFDRVLVVGWFRRYTSPLLLRLERAVRVCSSGAALTEKCRTIPAFVNQIPTDSCIDDERQYLVHFVLNSSAGFNVKHFTIT